MEGEVTEVTRWSDESKNDAVRVDWKKGPRGNIYRLGTNGKVKLFNKPQLCWRIIPFTSFLLMF